MESSNSFDDIIYSGFGDCFDDISGVYKGIRSVIEISAKDMKDDTDKSRNIPKVKMLQTVANALLPEIIQNPPIVPLKSRIKLIDELEFVVTPGFAEPFASPKEGFRAFVEAIYAQKRVTEVAGTVFSMLEQNMDIQSLDEIAAIGLGQDLSEGSSGVVDVLRRRVREIVRKDVPKGEAMKYVCRLGAFFVKEKEKKREVCKDTVSTKFSTIMLSASMSMSMSMSDSEIMDSDSMSMS